MSVTTALDQTVDETVELMHGLFGLDVDRIAPETMDAHFIAKYVDDAGNPVSFMACDMATGCRLGAALTQVPPGRIDEALRENSVPESLYENLAEILNIGVSIVTPEDGQRISLDRVVSVNEAEDFAAFKSELESLDQSTVAFSLARYGECYLVLSR